MSTNAAEVIQFVPRKKAPDKKVKPKSNGRPGTPGYKWSPAQRKKFLATAARKQAARFREERVERRQARLDRKAGLAAGAARRPSAEPAGGVSRRPTAAQDGRTGDSPAEQRLDAIVYLARAYAAYEGIPDDALLGVLALRRLQGRIK